MNIVNPMSQYCLFLLLALPGIWLVGLRLATLATQDLRLHYWLAPGLGLALWLLVTQLMAQVSASFMVGLWSASGLLALAGLYNYWRQKKQPVGDIASNQAVRLSSGMMWLTALATTLVIASIALRWHFHDEYFISGHMSIISQIQNGAFPPVHMTFPEQALKYHYGFDLFCAMITGLLRVPVDLSIDIATTLLWGYVWCLLWILGARMLSPGKAFILPLVMLFGGGLSFLGSVAYSGEPVLVKMLGLTQVEGHSLNAPFMSYFFQHPWALGMPFAVSILLLVLRQDKPHDTGRLSVLALLFVALSFSQAVLFLTLFGAFLLSECFRYGVSRRQQLGRLWLFFSIVVIAVLLVGGFFRYSPNSLQGFFLLRFGPFDSFATSVVWYALNFGVLLPLGLAGFFYLKSDRLFFATLLIGSLVVFNFVEYKLTYDIIKFAVIAFMALAFLSSLTLYQLLDGQKRIFRFLGVFGLLLATSSGLSFVSVAGLKLESSPLAAYDKGSVSLAVQDIEALNWLRQHMGQTDIVFRMRPASTGYAQWGGVPVLWVGIDGIYFGFSNETLSQRITLQTDVPPDPDAYLRQGVRWFVLAPWDKPFDQYMPQWLNKGKAVQRVAFSPLKIYELLP